MAYNRLTVEKYPSATYSAWMEEKYIYQLGDHGLEKINLETGEVVARQPHISDVMDADTPLSNTLCKNNSLKYSKLFSDIFVQFISEGKTISEICRMPGLPSLATVARWRAENPEFNSSIKIARQQRAENFADEIQNSAHATRDISKDEVPAERLFFDKLKWLAEKNDPDTYGNRVKHTGDADNPVSIIVSTGINRDLPPAESNPLQIEESPKEQENEDEY